MKIFNSLIIVGIVVLLFEPCLSQGPILTFPDDEGFYNDPYLEFSWESYPQAIYYHIQVDDDQAFESPLIDDSSASQRKQSASPTGLVLTIILSFSIGMLADLIDKRIN